MRQRAKQAGNLQTTPQEKVSTKGETIVIQPSAPDVVYVPEYDPWLVYGAPLPIFPGWSPYPGLFLDGPGIGFGLGFGIGLFAGYGWGWHHWGYDWHHDGRVEYNHNTYISHSRTIVNRNSFNSSRGTSIMAPIFAAGALAGTRAFTALTRTFREGCILAPSAVSITAAMREQIPSEGSPALAASMAEASEVEVSTAEVAAASTAAAEDAGSSHEVLKHETRNDKNDK